MYEEDESFLEKHSGKVMGCILLIVTAGGVFWYVNREPGITQSKPKPMSVVNIVLPPPPPPPPPPTPPKEPPPEPEIVQEEKTFVPEEVPEDAPPEPEPADPEPAPIGTGITGDGPPDGFGLSNRGGGGTMGGRIGGAGGGGSKYGRYAAKVQSAVTAAMRSNRTTRTAVMRVDVKIWADPFGRVTEVQLGRSTGDAELDRALRDEVLGNIRLPEPPPADMPMPIHLRLSARKS